MPACKAPWIALASAAGIALLGGCVSPSDPLGRVEALEEAQKRYTEAIRWGDLERASRYVVADQRAEFLALADAFESIRFTDYEIGELEVDDDGLARAEVVVSYEGYVLPHYLERRVSDRQVWVRDGAVGNHWVVQPQLALLIDEMGGRVAP
jgi:hypothetical protein